MNIRIFQNHSVDQIRNLLGGIAVSPKGIEIMQSKCFLKIVKVDNVTAAQANILKQEMLSLGADTALPWQCVKGGTKKYSCILIGTNQQFNLLISKLNSQVLGLKQIADSIQTSLRNYSKNIFKIRLPNFNLEINKRTLIMATINRTPDSFSDAGLYYDENSCIKRICDCLESGADIIDIGGESTRPGSKPVDVKEELRRVLPIVKKIAKIANKPISIDTTKSEVAYACLQEGADIINDISASNKDSKMAKVVSKAKAGYILMHCKGTPNNMQKNPKYKSVVDEITQYLASSISKVLGSGVAADKIIIDPGIGISFGKTVDHNLEIIGNLRDFKILGKPILIGVSRKSFIGEITKRPVNERLFGTVGALSYAILQGANIVRVHDVAEVKQAIDVVDAIKNPSIS